MRPRAARPPRPPREAYERALQVEPGARGRPRQPRTAAARGRAASPKASASTAARSSPAATSRCCSTTWACSSRTWAARARAMDAYEKALRRGPALRRLPLQPRAAVQVARARPKQALKHMAPVPQAGEARRMSGSARSGWSCATASSRAPAFEQDFLGPEQAGDGLRIGDLPLAHPARARSRAAA